MIIAICKVYQKVTFKLRSEGYRAKQREGLALPGQAIMVSSHTCKPAVVPMQTEGSKHRAMCKTKEYLIVCTLPGFSRKWTPQSRCGKR